MPQSSSSSSASSSSAAEDLLCSQFGQLSSEDHRSQHRSQNITESVPVPSSEHVAEIVGRQGCKIKALRAKTNTYIKTPIRGEAPMFVITGRREDVMTAKREIQLAADHFSQIRAKRGSSSPTPAHPASPRPITRPSSLSPSIAENPLIYKHHNLTYQQQPALMSGHVSKKVNVPYQVVGLVVGPKGSTIKRIQQNTNTYIITPSRDCEPVFEIQGLPECVEAARIEIENYIQLRTNQCIAKEPSPAQAVSLSSSCSGSVGQNDLNDDLDFNLYQSVVNSVVDDDECAWPDKPSRGSSLDMLISSFQNRSSSSSSSSASSSTSSSFCSNELSLNHLHNTFMFNTDSLYSPLVDLYQSNSTNNSHIINSIFQHEQLLQQLAQSNQDLVFNDSIF